MLWISKNNELWPPTYIFHIGDSNLISIGANCLTFIVSIPNCPKEFRPIENNFSSNTEIKNKIKNSNLLTLMYDDIHMKFV